jgi:imidazolonepropionase-like amidohydrolase
MSLRLRAKILSVRSPTLFAIPLAVILGALSLLHALTKLEIMRTLPGLALILLSIQFVRSADLVITGATVYPSPKDPPISDAVIIVHAGKIAAIGSRASVHIPGGAQRLDYTGAYVTAGFWNSHVHIITPASLNAKQASAAQLDTETDRMFNRWGFTSVFDIASILENTLALRNRVNQGNVRGPRILTAGEPLWTVQPVYIQQFLLDHHLPMPVIRSPLEAQRQVASEIDRGADGTKLFTGSVQAGSVANMPIDIARAAVGEAHRHSVPVFAHPQNSAGVNIAIEAGVDILAACVFSNYSQTATSRRKIRPAQTRYNALLTGR